MDKPIDLPETQNPRDEASIPPPPPAGRARFSVMGIEIAMEPVHFSDRETIHDTEKFIEFALGRIAQLGGKPPSDGGLATRELMDRLEACGIRFPSPETSSQ